MEGGETLSAFFKRVCVSDGQEEACPSKRPRLRSPIQTSHKGQEPEDQEEGEGQEGEAEEGQGEEGEEDQER